MRRLANRRRVLPWPHVRPWVLPLAAALAVAVLLLPATAGAHPLGNFSVNTLSELRVSDRAVDVAWTLDQAEIPTFRERGDAPSAVLGRKLADARRGLRLTVDGRPVGLRVLPGARVSFPAGQGGLRTTRVEARLRATLAERPDRVELRDTAYPGRVGWRSIITRPGAGTAVRSSVPSADPTGGLRRYPAAELSSPADVRAAALTVAAGHGTVAAPGVDTALRTTTDRGGAGGLGGRLEALLAGDGALLVLLLAAFGWGAVHALSPGHGKTMVAAYLVGTRGRARDAVALGGAVTVTHTAGVFALGGVALGLSHWILPEQLFPWLALVSGLLVVSVGVALLRGRVRNHAHHHHHDHEHHHHDHDRRGILAMGAAAGLVPCPSALVVLLAAIAQDRAALGLLLVVAFSLGLAATLSGLGLLVVAAGRALSAARVPVRAVAVLPTVSAVVIVGAGVLLTARAIPGVVA
jgi:nickel/cobalt transporter (NicO) family protein